MANDFINKITKIIEDNISNEQFGVSELASVAGMSRSNLLRKIKNLTRLSASQFIREVRLKNAMEKLKSSSSNVSEVAFQVGFSSTSYFIKCFRDYYGYPPGEVGKRDDSHEETLTSDASGHSHQLAAIMFTDIEGYTALMQQDEAKAVEFRNRHREVFNAMIKKFNGRILQYYGDGTLSTFTSVIDAVKCAIEMQLKFRNAPEMPVRIGIHSGDIIFTEDDIIGDGVNVASRIESLAASGSVFISDKVYDEVKNQQGILTTSMGIFELKNVGKSIEIFAISNAGLVVPDKDKISGKVKIKEDKKSPESTSKKKKAGLISSVVFFIVLVSLVVFYSTGLFEKLFTSTEPVDPDLTKKSIAVLPFINDSDDSSNVYIVNGLMESILNNLQKIEDLRVISRTSVEKYRNNPITISEIANELNVKYIIEGSGQKIGDQILLNIQLIDAPVDKHLWSEQFKREVKDIFQLQMEIAENIADKIEVIITPEEQERINKIPTDNLVAYDHFLKGQDYFYEGLRGNRESFNPAIELFKDAVEQDSLFAFAYANIAISYYMLDIYQAIKLFADSINKYADKALFHDPDLSQSLLAKAFFYLNSTEVELALPYLEKALESNPNSTMVINTLSSYYAEILPDTKKYLEYALKGIQLDIAAGDSLESSIVYLHIANAFIQSGFIDEAEKYINLSIEYDPDNIYSAYVKTYILYTRDNDLKILNQQLTEVFYRDTTRLDVVQEVAKTWYFMRDLTGLVRIKKSTWRILLN